MTSYHERTKLSFSQNYTRYEGTAKNFWKEMIHAYTEEDAKELKRLMDASSLSHAQAQRLMIYALKNCSDDGFMFITRKFFSNLYGPRTLDHIMFTIEALLHMSKEEKLQHLMEEYGRSEDSEGSLKFYSHLMRCTEEEYELTARFVNNFCASYPFGPAEDAHEIRSMSWEAYQAQWQVEELLDKEFDTIQKDAAIENTRNEILKRPIKRLEDSEEYLQKILAEVKQKKDELKSKTGDTVTLHEMGVDITSIIENMEKNHDQDSKR